jgi:hypothetical protein
MKKIFCLSHPSSLILHATFCILLSSCFDATQAPLLAPAAPQVPPYGAMVGEPTPTSDVILWIPHEDSNIEDVIDRISTNPELRLTIAISKMPANLAGKLNSLQSKGQIEFAMRIANDPVLPLLYYPSIPSVSWIDKPSTGLPANNPYFFALRMADAKEKFQKNFKKTSAGFVNLSGGVTGDYAVISKTVGMKWVSCGPFVSTMTYDMLNSEGVFFVPFSVPESTSTIFLSTEPLKFWVIDETLNDETRAKSRDVLFAIASSSDVHNYLTVSKAIEIATSTEVPKNEIENFFKPWTGDYSLWASSPAQFGAMLALDKTRQELGIFLNSVQGDMKLAKNLYEDLYLLESSSIFIKLSNPDTEIFKETEENFQSGLSDIYKQMNHSVPSWLFNPLTDFSSKAGFSEKVEISSGASFFVFKNTSKKPDLPSKTPSLPETADPYKIWKLDSLKVEWDDKDITLGFKPLEIDNSKKEPAGFNHIFIDLYIDINHRFRAGFGKPLDGRNARIFPEDAWEYALALNSKKAEVFKISATKLISAFSTKPELDRQSNYIYVRIPRSILRGNPNLWGYSAFMMLGLGGTNMHIADILAKEVANGYVYSIRIK